MTLEQRLRVACRNRNYGEIANVAQEMRRAGYSPKVGLDIIDSEGTRDLLSMLGVIVTILGGTLLVVWFLEVLR